MDIPLEIKAFAAIGLLLASFLGGYHLKAKWDQAKEDRIAKQVSDHLRVVEARNVTLQAKLDEALNNVKTVTVTVTKRIPYVVNHYIEKPGQPVKERPVYYFTWADVSLWNAALDLSVSGSASGTSRPASEAYSLSPITLSDAFRNHALNAGQYLSCLNTVHGWQAWYQTVHK